MKWTGLLGIVCAAVLGVACERNTLNDRDDDNRPSTIEQRDALEDRDDSRDTVGTSGLGRPVDARGFVNEVSMVNHAEVQMAQLASERAQSAEVKQFAQMMIRDHTRAGNELKQAVSRHNVQMTAEMDAKHDATMSRLRNLRGAEFDREYMKAMVEGHQDARDLIGSRAGRDASTHGGVTGTTGDRRTGTTGTAQPGDRPAGTTAGADAQLDTAVDQWAMKTLPAVEQHLQRAQQIHDKLENRTTAGSNTPTGAGATGTTGRDTTGRDTTGQHHSDDANKQNTNKQKY